MGKRYENITKDHCIRGLLQLKENDYLAHRFNEITLFMLLTTYRLYKKLVT